MIKRHPPAPGEDLGTPFREFLAGVLGLLGVGFGAFFALLLCGELALAGGTSPAILDTRSRTRADYSPWGSLVIHRVEAQIVEAILQDPTHSPEGTLAPAMIAAVPGAFWGPPLASDSGTPSSPAPAGATLAGPADTTPSPPPMATPSFLPTRPLSPSMTPSRTSTAPPMSPSGTPISPTATMPGVPSATFIPATRQRSEAPDTSPPTNGEGDYFLCDQTGPQTARLCVGGAGGNARSGTGMVPCNFYSEPLSAGEISGSTPGHIFLYATNSTGMSIPIGVMVYAGAGAWSPLGGQSLIVPANTGTPVLLSGDVNLLSHTVSPGEILRLEIVGGPGTSFYWDGEYGDSRISIP